MSMFGQQQSQSMSMFIAEQEMELVTGLFNNMVDTCYKKCISTAYHDGEMNKGESVCTDRCVSKFFAVSTMVNDKFAASQQQMQQQ